MRTEPALASPPPGAPPRPAGAARASALLHLLHLSSPTLPIGAYAYSQGIEAAVAAGLLPTVDAVEAWVGSVLTHVQAKVDVPLLARHHAAWAADDPERALAWSRELLAQRESRELQDEDASLGSRLATLLRDLGCARATHITRSGSPTLASAFALAAVHWEIDLPDAAHGYLFAWIEGQIAAATKLVPLGQTEAQRALVSLLAAVPGAAAHGLSLPDDEIGASAPALGVLSAHHETQYTRLFRS